MLTAIAIHYLLDEASVHSASTDNGKGCWRVTHHNIAERCVLLRVRRCLVDCKAFPPATASLHLPVHSTRPYLLALAPTRGPCTLSFVSRSPRSRPYCWPRPLPRSSNRPRRFARSASTP